MPVRRIIGTGFTAGTGRRERNDFSIREWPEWWLGIEPMWLAHSGRRHLEPSAKPVNLKPALKDRQGKLVEKELPFSIHLPRPSFPTAGQPVLRHQRPIGADAVELLVVGIKKARGTHARNRKVSTVRPRRILIQGGAVLHRVKPRGLAVPGELVVIGRENIAPERGDAQHVRRVVRIGAGEVFSQLLLQPEKQVPRRRRDGDAARSVGGRDSVNARRPASARKIAVLLQGVAARVRPRNDDAVASMGDGQVGQSRRLHDGNKTPETAGQRITAAGHGAAGIRLTDGAADLVGAARAGAAAAGNFIPVHGVALPQRPKAEG